MSGICAPAPFMKFARAGICPDCKQRTRFIGFAYEWYGANQTCIKCGRRWSDGEWMPLEFMPQSRQKSIESAKKAFRRYSQADVDASMKEFKKRIAREHRARKMTAFKAKIMRFIPWLNRRKS